MQAVEDVATAGKCCVLDIDVQVEASHMLSMCCCQIL